MRVVRALAAAALLALSSPLFAQDGRPSREPSPPPPRDSPFFFGGNIGFGFGDVNWVSVAPLAGVHVSERLQVGVDATLQYTSDSRYDPTFSKLDYGAGAFGRYLLFDRVFAEVGYEYLSYGVRNLFTGVEGRRGASAVLAGGGFAQPVGYGGTVLVIEALYNFTYEKQGGPYGQPIIFRAGVNVGF